MKGSARVVVNAEVRPATLNDLRTLGTWSGQVEGVFRPAVESDDQVLLVAFANGRFPIGHVLVGLGGLRGTISHLLVLAGFRDQGLGSALMAEAEDLIRGTGATQSRLAVEKVNVDAIRLYEHLGYMTAGESVETWPEPVPDGTLQPVHHPAWVMKKSL